MFRRRALIRSARRAAFVPDIPPLLQRANDLMAGGEYPAAAAAFEELARLARTRNGPRAPFLFLQAGRARLLAGQNEAGLAHFKQGLALLAARGQWPLLNRAGNRVVEELKERNMTAEAKRIEDYLKTTLPPDLPAEPAVAGRRPALPTHCPGCGGPVRPDEVEWLDEVTAECSYCGSPLRGEN